MAGAETWIGSNQSQRGVPFGAGHFLCSFRSAGRAQLEFGVIPACRARAGLVALFYFNVRLPLELQSGRDWGYSRRAASRVGLLPGPLGKMGYPFSL
jgi:hypothetical protein